MHFEEIKKEKKKSFSQHFTPLQASGTAGEEECSSPVFTEGVIIHSLRLHVRVEVLLFFYCRGGQDTHFFCFVFFYQQSMTAAPPPTDISTYWKFICILLRPATHCLWCGTAEKSHKHCERNVAISLVLALKRWDRVRDGRCHALVTKEIKFWHRRKRPQLTNQQLMKWCWRWTANSNYIVHSKLHFLPKFIKSMPYSAACCELKRLYKIAHCVAGLIPNNHEGSFPFDSDTNVLLVLISLSSFNSSGSQKSVPKYVPNKYLADVRTKDRLNFCITWVCIRAEIMK